MKINNKYSHNISDLLYRFLTLMLPSSGKEKTQSLSIFPPSLTRAHVYALTEEVLLRQRGRALWLVCHHASIVIRSTVLSAFLSFSECALLLLSFSLLKAFWRLLRRNFLFQRYYVHTNECFFNVMFLQLQSWMRDRERDTHIQ